MGVLLCKRRAMGSERADPENIESREPAVIPFGSELQVLPARRMDDAERMRLQKEPTSGDFFPHESILFPIPVACVSDQRMADAGEVPSDLVHSPRRRTDLHEGESRRRMAAKPFLDRKFRDSDPRVVSERIGARDGSFDPPFCFNPTSNDGDIGFLNGPFPELSLNMSRRLGVEGEEKDP